MPLHPSEKDEEADDFLEGSLLKVLVWRKEKWMSHALQRNQTICESEFCHESHISHSKSY